MASYRPVVWQKLAMDNTAESLVVGTADDELLHDRAGAAIFSGIAEACWLGNAVIRAAQDLLRALTAPR